MKILKWVLLSLFILILIGVIAVFIASQERPTGNTSKEADLLAQNMVKALNYKTYSESKFLTFSFRGAHDYLYYIPAKKLRVKWDDIEVYMYLETRRGRAFIDGKEVMEEEKQKLLDKAWNYWCNDSFWVLAPFKVFDPGTTRKIVKDSDGKEGLLVEYATGGTTPGDAYLWYLDENLIPTGWRMWTSILPVKGLYSSWEGWEKHNDTWYSTKHKMVVNLEITNLGIHRNWRIMGYNSDPLWPLTSYK